MTNQTYTQQARSQPAKKSYIDNRHIIITIVTYTHTITGGTKSINRFSSFFPYVQEARHSKCTIKSRDFHRRFI
jgi:anaerobic ribonucleoside-triphosphate reductase